MGSANSMLGEEFSTHYWRKAICEWLGTFPFCGFQTQRSLLWISSGLVLYLYCLYSRVRHNSEEVLGILNSQWKNRETIGQCRKAQVRCTQEVPGLFFSPNWNGGKLLPGQGARGVLHRGHMSGSWGWPQENRHCIPSTWRWGFQPLIHKCWPLWIWDLCP